MNWKKRNRSSASARLASVGVLCALMASPAFAQELAPPVRLQADGAPIDIGKLSRYAHAGPAFADIDGDGDRDLLIGDFPGNFWLFDNAGTDSEPAYRSKGQLEAGGKAAKTPVY